ncbi:MAG TPA: choice-of-anchor Q domain-containing protein [Saprospiraceae bacterium]|nr:choice-of-anchor Q domain-containing protein [Saprospiraceae bacterium]
MKKSIVFFSMLIAFSMWQSTSAAQTYFVKTDGNDMNDGSSWAMAFQTVQKALEEACMNSPADIWVAAGTYFPDQGLSQTPGDRESTFSICAEVSLYGGFEGTESMLEERNWVLNVTVLSGDLNEDDTYPMVLVTSNPNFTDNAYHVITISGMDNNGVVDGFTIRGGWANGDGMSNQDIGGGILMREMSSPGVYNCNISFNFAMAGGGIFNLISFPTIRDCVFERNAANGSGGAIVYGNTGGAEMPLVISNTRFFSNRAENGGGAYYSTSSETQFINCEFRSNFTNGSGGAIEHNTGGSSDFINCTFSGNHAGSGGGAIVNIAAINVSIINCTFSTNAAPSGLGGAIFGPATNFIIQNSIIWNNYASGVNNTLSASISISEFDDGPIISHSIIANSKGSGANWEDGLGIDGGGNLDTNPLFVGPADFSTPHSEGDWRLTCLSPAIDRGNNAFVPAGIDTDLDGNERIFNEFRVDIGAFEFQGSSCITIPTLSTWMTIILTLIMIIAAILTLRYSMIKKVHLVKEKIKTPKN